MVEADSTTKPWWRQWWVIAIAVIILAIVLMYIFLPGFGEGVQRGAEDAMGD